MCNWHDITVRKIRITAQTIQDACSIIHQTAQAHQKIPYSEIMTRLKANGHRGINRGTIGSILGEVSEQVSSRTNPSIYPSSIVVHISGDKQPGIDFWLIDTGTNPPCNVLENQRSAALSQYQNDTYNLNGWNCNC